jgi:predicted permease
VVLVVGAALLVRTLVHLQSLSPGFDATNVLRASASLDDARYREADAVNRLFDRTLDEIRRVTGVESAAVGLHVPYQRWLNDGVRVRRSSNATAGFAGTSMNYVTPGYFETLRIPLRAGRTFSDADTRTSEPVAIVNEDFVRQLLKGEDALQSSIVSGKEVRRIVGVVANVQQQPGLTRGGPLKPEPALYIPASQFSSQGFRMAHTWFAPSWIIRTRASETSAGAAIARAVAAVDPMLPVNEVQTMIEERNGSLQTQRVNAGLLGSVAALAVILALVGIYGLVTHLVADRTHEFGIRMALGSSTIRTLWTAVRQPVLLSVAGAVIGACVAGVGVRALKSLLYGVEPVDAASFTAGMLGIVAVASAASLIPALRLVWLDTGSVLRHE